MRENKLQDKEAIKDYELLKEELEYLEEKHKEVTDKRTADKLKVVYALGVGKSVGVVMGIGYQRARCAVWGVAQPLFL